MRKGLYIYFAASQRGCWKSAPFPFSRVPYPYPPFSSEPSDRVYGRIPLWMSCVFSFDNACGKTILWPRQTRPWFCSAPPIFIIFFVDKIDTCARYTYFFLSILIPNRVVNRAFVKLLWNYEILSASGTRDVSVLISTPSERAVFSRFGSTKRYTAPRWKETKVRAE